MTRINIQNLEQDLTLAEGRQVVGSGYGYGYCFPSYPVYTLPVYKPVYQPLYVAPVYTPIYRPYHCW